MKHFLLFLFFLAITGQANAMSCSGTGSIIETGYTIDQVIHYCGQPAAKNTYTETSNLEEEWTYFQPSNGENIQFTLSFNRGRLTNINVLNTSNSNNQTCQVKNQFNQMSTVSCRFEHNVTSTGFCRQLIQVGNMKDYIQSVCGAPAKERIISGVKTEVTELTYKGAGPDVLVFRDNKLADWKY